MLDFLKANLSTIIVGAVVLGTIALIVVRLVVNKKKGITSCGCGSCTSCSGHNSHTKMF